jgi:hypothetical protein
LFFNLLFTLKLLKSKIITYHFCMKNY